MKHIHKLITAILSLGFVSVAIAENPFQRAYDNACTERATATVASCKAWIDETQKSPQGKSEDAQLTIGAAYMALEQFFGANEQDKASYRARAREVYSAVVKQNLKNTEGALGLSNTADTIDARIAYLRQGLAADPTNLKLMNYLAQFLTFNTGNVTPTLAEISEAAELRERIFENSPDGRYKWNQAALAIFLYKEAGREADAEAMRGRARAAYRYDDVAAQLSRPELMNAEDLNSTLTSICGLDVNHFADSNWCIDSVKSTANAVDKAPASSAEKLADAASLGVQAAAQLGIGGKSLTDSLEKIIASGHATPNTFGAYGTLVPDRHKRLEVMEAGAAKFPNDAGLAIAAGLAELDVGQHDDAVRSFRRAKGLATEAQQPAIDRLIEKASKQ
jgi:tetratricopeptide (TPR) repeat protein